VHVAIGERVAIKYLPPEGGEDIDFAYRLFNAGVKIVLNRQASSVHFPHPQESADNSKFLMANHRYMAAKYGTPIIELLTEWPESFEELTADSVTPNSMSDVIRERGVPSCSEYLSRQGVRGAAEAPEMRQ
jgi:hypothetical protein